MLSLMERITVLLFYLFRVFPVNNNKIVIVNNRGSGYGGEGKLIADELIRTSPDLSVVWPTKQHDDTMPENILQMPYHSIRTIYNFATAKIWIDNKRKQPFFRKRKNQFYIQAWHGGGPCLKFVEKDAGDQLTKHYQRMAQHDSQMADVIVSGCDWRTNNIRDAFWYDGDILKQLISEDYSDQEFVNENNKRVHRFFKLQDETKLLVYVPTYRDSKDVGVYKIDFKGIVDGVKQRFGGNWAIIVRLHPNIKNLSDQIYYTDEIINGSFYPNVDDLLIASDYIITDYSGCIFSGFRFNKRVILYTPDLDQYLDKERGFYFDIRSLPAPISYNNNELINTILEYDDLVYRERINSFNKEVGYYQCGTDKIVTRIMSVINGGNES